MERFEDTGERRHVFHAGYTREDAERAIRTALLALDLERLEGAHLGDLRMAIDAYAAACWGFAVMLALGAIRERRESRGAPQPEVLKSAGQLKRAFVKARGNHRRRPTASESAR